MAVFKCKMCGASLDVKPDAKVVLCEYCDSQNTLPKLDDEKKVNLYDRANHFRRKNEYDKAMAIYEQILSEDQTDSEAYWSIVLCRYGIDYVEDPRTHKRMPTINRMQNQSILADVDYLKALEFADAVQKDIYIEEAKKINEIQKKIHLVIEQTESFDIFICYKRSDEQNRRTIDSVRASELYQELIKEGYKTFFAEITLEDKLGVEYEPYIFSALQSSKIMIVIGSKKEYFDAVWVKNEWSRYLSLMNKGEKKYLIPVYLNMDPYDLPTEFSYLQAQDMGKLGFVPDLIRGIKKLIGEAKPVQKEIEKNSPTQITTSNLEKRIRLFLEDGDFENAKAYCEKILDLDSENAFAYIGRLLVEYRCKTLEELKNKASDYSCNNNYLKAYRFGTSKQKEELEITLKGSLYAIASELIANNLFKESEVDVELGDSITHYDLQYPFDLYDELIPNYEEIIKCLKACEGYMEANSFMQYYQQKIDCYYEFRTEEIMQAFKNKDFTYCIHLVESVSKQKYSKESFLETLQNYLLKLFDANIEKEKEEEINRQQELKNQKIKQQQELEGKRKQYDLAVNYMEHESYYSAMVIFEQIKPFEDAEEKYQICKKENDRMVYRYERKKSRKEKIILLFTLLIVNVANIFLYWKYASSFSPENNSGTGSYLTYTYLALALFVAMNCLLKVKKEKTVIAYILCLIINFITLIVLSVMYPDTGGVGEAIIGGIVFAILGALAGFVILCIFSISKKKKK